MKTRTLVLLLFLALLLGGALGFFGCKHFIRPEVIERTDTVTLTEVHIVDHPVPYTVYRDRVDSVKVPVPVPGKTDTLFVNLPKEVREYKDSCYYARVSGIQPSLDYIETYNKTQIVTKTVTLPAPRVSFGVQVGVGAVGTFTNPVPQFGYYVGVGGQWRF